MARSDVEEVFDIANIRELREDAARYRWLRSRDLETITKGGVFVGLTPENLVISGDHLDLAVDSAMRAERLGDGS